MSLLRTLHRSAPVVAIGIALAMSPAPGDAASYDFTVIASTGAPFTSLPEEAPSLDDDGAVAFIGTAAGVQRILVASQSSVMNLLFQRYGLNDADQLAFQVSLADQRKLIVRADPGPIASCACITQPVPEPEALAELVALLGLVLLKRSPLRL